MNYPDWLRVDPASFDLTSIEPRSRLIATGEEIERSDAERIHQENIEALQELQYMMWAEHKHKLLVVLQALDTGGKDGAIRNTFGPLNPQGVRTQAFKKPTEVELQHDFLWRVHQHVPKAGHIQVFNRSHYEDVLVVRVHDLVPEAKWRARYAHIRNFEKLLADEGTMIVKVMLHITRAEQKERLQKRLDNPEKHWKFDPNDLKERAHWDAYMEAFQEAIVQTSTDYAPWYVIPADRKWFRNYALSTTVRDVLENVEMRWPEPAEGLHNITIED